MAEVQLFSADKAKNLCRKYYNKNELSFEEFNKTVEILSYELKDIGSAPKGFLGRHQYLNILVRRKLLPIRDLNNNNDKFELNEKIMNGNNESGINGNGNDKNYCEETLEFFVKSMPSSEDFESQVNYIEEFGVFEKEINVYEFIIPKLEKYGEFAPKCFLIDKNKSLLIFENLFKQGFRLLSLNDAKTLDYDHLKCALKTLAKMHSASLIYESKINKDLSNLYGNYLIENAYPVSSDNKGEESIRVKVFKKATQVILEFIKNIPKYKNSSDLSYILKEFPIKFSSIFDLMQPCTNGKFHNVFSHGDLWLNNIMFKYDDDKLKQPISCRLVDFQLARYAPPIIDVLTLITIQTTREFRKLHLNNLLNIYYEYLNENFIKYSLNVNDFINREEYESSINHYKIIGIIESCLFSHLTLLPNEIAKELTTNSEHFKENWLKNRTELCMKAFITNETYRERMTDMVMDIVDNFILCNKNNNK